MPAGKDLTPCGAARYLTSSREPQRIDRADLAARSVPRHRCPPHGARMPQIRPAPRPAARPASGKLFCGARAHC